MKNKITTNKNSYGLTLVELMIAMTVSSILMLGISEIFTLNKQSYNVQDENARMQESGRYAFNILMTDMRRAGYFGGNANTSEITGTIAIAVPTRDCVSTTTNWARMIQRPFYGLDDGNTDTDRDSATVNYTGCIPNADYLRGDIIVTRYSKGTPVTAFDADKLYIRSSMFSGRLFKGSEATTGDIVAGTGNYVSETPNAVHQLAANAYYVGPSGRNCRFKDSSNADIPIPALLRETLSDAGLPVKEEVANGIEHLQFQYGIDTNGDTSVNMYINADELSNDETISPNWTQIVTVRMWVLVRADCPTNDYTNTKSYTMGNLPGGVYTPNDSFKRQLYTTTVALRN